MTSIKIRPSAETTGLQAIDIERALERGRRLRSRAVGSLFKNAFRSLFGRRGSAVDRPAPIGRDCVTQA